MMLEKQQQNQLPKWKTVKLGSCFGLGKQGTTRHDSQASRTRDQKTDAVIGQRPLGLFGLVTSSPELMRRGSDMVKLDGIGL